MRFASAAICGAATGATVDGVLVLVQALSNSKDDNAEDSMIPGLIDISVPKNAKVKWADF
jgi:hypothetical protein